MSGTRSNSMKWPKNTSQHCSIKPLRTMRVRFAREGAPSYLAHLDMKRLFERSLRRTGISLAYTEGFNPMPCMTFALPLAIGVDTTDDYADFGLMATIEPTEFIRRMNEALPDGIRILDAKVVTESSTSLMASVQAACYFIRVKGLGDATARLPTQGALMVAKKGKDEVKSINVRPLLLGIKILDTDTIRILVKAGSHDNLRPDLFLQALVDYANLPQESADDAEIIRTSLFTTNTGGALCSLM